jgi:hypothetical protein
LKNGAPLDDFRGAHAPPRVVSDALVADIPKVRLAKAHALPKLEHYRAILWFDRLTAASFHVAYPYADDSAGQQTKDLVMGGQVVGNFHAICVSV